MYRTWRGILYPDGKIEIRERNASFDRPVAVMVTILEDEFQKEMKNLSEVGEYSRQLMSYEERLANGEIQWK